jgi:DNA polymerase III delta prime subunit
MDIDEPVSDSVLSGLRFQHIKSFLNAVVHRLLERGALGDLFKISDSLSNLVEDTSEAFNSPLKFPVQHRDGVFDPLSVDSHAIYSLHDDPGVRYRPPYRRFYTSRVRPVIFIGPSGCGKTRTCFDYARENFSFYFDCNDGGDIHSMLDIIKQFPVDNLTKLEGLCSRAINSLIFSRMVIFEVLRRSNVSAADWMDYQRSGRTQMFSAKLFQEVWNVFSKLEPEDTTALYIQENAETNITLIFDEAQQLLQIHPNCFQSQKKELDRSFFSFVVQNICKKMFCRTIWCGTHLRLRDVSLFASAIGGKSEEIEKFSSFDYLEPSIVAKALCKWIRQDLVTDGQIRVMSIMLQGRPRLLMQFMILLCQIFLKQASFTSDDIQQAFYEYISKVTKKRQGDATFFSLYNRWEEIFDQPIKMFMKTDDTSETISSICVRLLLNYYLHRDIDKMPLLSETSADIVSSALIMLRPQRSDYRITLTEPVAIIAAENFLNTKHPNWIEEYFGRFLFSDAGISPAEKGNFMEFLISHRFRQGWWKKSAPLNNLLAGTGWLNMLNEIETGPVSLLDCRTGKDLHLQFIDFIENPRYPCLLLPTTKAGPDIAFQSVLCFIKTTWTGKDMKISAEELNANIATMEESEWFRSASAQHVEVQAALKRCKRKFLKFRIELPYSGDENFQKHDVANGIINIDMSNAELARDLLGEYFFQLYSNWIKQKQ